MQENAQRRRIRQWHTLRKQPPDRSGEHVAGASGGQAGIGKRGDHGLSVRFGYGGVGTLQDDDLVPLLGRATHPLYALRAGQAGIGGI